MQILRYLLLEQKQQDMPGRVESCIRQAVRPRRTIHGVSVEAVLKFFIEQGLLSKCQPAVPDLASYRQSDYRGTLLHEVVLTAIPPLIKRRTFPEITAYLKHRAVVHHDEAAASAQRVADASDPASDLEARIAVVTSSISSVSGSASEPIMESSELVDAAIAVCKLLISQYKLDVMLEDGVHRTVLSIAQRRGLTALAEYLNQQVIY